MIKFEAWKVEFNIIYNRKAMDCRGTRAVRLARNVTTHNTYINESIHTTEYRIDV